MGREIDFRAWLKDEKEMIEVKAIDFDEDGNVICVNYPKGKAYSGYNGDNIELMQFTGLKDKNGVKIFEGDIVNYYGRNAIVKIGFPHDEKWYPYGVCIEYIKYNLKEVEYVYKLELKDLEVIGNVWENKELLKNA